MRDRKYIEDAERYGGGCTPECAWCGEQTGDGIIIKGETVCQDCSGEYDNAKCDEAEEREIEAHFRR